ncbi:MAG: GerMN domain-containing protein [Candidatus Limiplasma sp.]|nr:GerMN domain-containing protein [Candidatus Limiplasma sp.]
MKIKRADIERILILCAAVLVVVLALRGNQQTTSQTMYEQEGIPISETSADTQVQKVSTTVFYEDGEGYLVPVTRQIPKTDGIAKASLALMVKSSQNDMEAARLGLRTVIPEDTTFEIDIQNGKARVDVSKEALDCASAQEEALMVSAIANTMTNFSTVDEVELLFDGQKRSKLTYGTDVSSVFSQSVVNLESVETFEQGGNLVQLYFPSQTGRLLVPVTRTVFSDADPTTAMVELAKGPQSDSGLERALPQNSGVRSVTMKDGVVTVDFSKEFQAALEQSDGGRQTIRAILFTCSQFPGVKKVQLMVEGKPLSKQPESATTFINEEEEVIAQYPGVIEVD